ncbi:hypothetical protein NLG97_g8382 [Lecanicillium saksenae]|uniref:Uncharacterized protein n=1 Tax=Lecanicillium saksenae TaxID=468837 RepID=A0ACC1QMC7_9HYPO|nr:hypothetical protein NLG97_g8382 [Lecanicillium saksenae]
MPTHFHSTLSDEGIDDEDMRGMDCSQASRGDRSSPVQGNLSDFNWLLSEGSADHDLSGGGPYSGQLPETVPIPSQLEVAQAEVVESIENRRRLDYSETCSTTRRSSPCHSGFTGNPWDFGNGRTEIVDLNGPEEETEVDALRDLVPEAPKRAKVSSTTKAPPNKKSEQQQKKPYNTRPRRKISYADNESSSGDSEASGVDESPEPEPRPWPADSSKDTSATKKPSHAKLAKKPSPAKKHSPAKKPNGTKKPGPVMNYSRAKQQVEKPATRNSPKGDVSAEESTENKSPQTSEKGRKRQRPKTPLPIDDQTHIVPPTLPATPPGSNGPAKKRQRRQNPRQPAKGSCRSKKKPSKKTPLDAPAIGNSIESDPIQPAQPPITPQTRDAGHQCHATTEAPNEEQPRAENDDHTQESAHSTERTTPSALPSPRRISSVQVPIPSHQNPLPLPLPSSFNEFRESVDPIQVIRPRPLRGLSALMSRDISRRDEDIGQRLQEIHKRIDAHLQEREKDALFVASVYRKNGAACVDRLQKRFLKERQILSRKLKNDMDTFTTTLNGAKRNLAVGSKDRQKILKELERNTVKRKHSCTNEINRIKDIAKRVQIH